MLFDDRQRPVWVLAQDRRKQVLIEGLRVPDADTCRMDVGNGLILLPFQEFLWEPVSAQFITVAVAGHLVFYVFRFPGISHVVEDSDFPWYDEEALLTRHVESVGRHAVVADPVEAPPGRPQV